MSKKKETTSAAPEAAAVRVRIRETRSFRGIGGMLSRVEVQVRDLADGEVFPAGAVEVDAAEPLHPWRTQ